MSIERVATFWFATHGEHGPFDQLAAALRHRGHRIIRLTHSPQPSRIRRADVLLFHRVVTIDDLLSGRDGPRPDEHTVDLQWTETMSQAMPEAAIDRFPPELAVALRRRRELSNKRRVAELLQESGIEVAPHLGALEHSDEDAVARLGLPLVVKAEIGAAASGVRFAHTLDEVATAVDELDPSRASLFFQPLLRAEVRNYGGVIGADGRPLEDFIVRQFGQVGGHRPGREVVDDPAMLAYGRAVCAALGITGPIDIEAIDHDGRPLLIDLNPRAWGSMMSMRMIGTAFDARYLTALGLPTPAPAGRPGAGDRFLVFPTEVEMHVSAGSWLRAAATFLRRAPRLARWLGPRYLLHVVALRVAWRLEGAGGGVGLPSAETA